ncbi:MAG: dienelactone hydrolase family protein [Pseudomonadales bacterium]|nr:dienelactone hydrolase family protein [Pseudomonadales bacterium]
MELPGFTSFDFGAKGYRHKVYKKGDDSGPGILLIQELPGIQPETIRFAERLHNDGYTVYLPHLFGAVNVEGGQPLQNLAKVCVSFEFRLLATKRKSPVTNWLRALAAKMQTATGGPVAAIGLCFTGSFALALMVDDTIAAPVLCEPGHVDGMFTKKQRASSGVTDEEMAAAVARSEKDDVPVMGFRFTHDVMCPKARFDYLSDLFGERFRRFEIDSSLFNEHKIPIAAHSVFTVHYVDEPDHPTRKAYEALLEFLEERLVTSAAS